MHGSEIRVRNSKNSKLDPELIIPDPQHWKEGTPSLQHRYQIIEGFTGIYLEFNVLWYRYCCWLKEIDKNDFKITVFLIFETLKICLNLFKVLRNFFLLLLTYLWLLYVDNTFHSPSVHRRWSGRFLPKKGTAIIF